MQGKQHINGCSQFPVLASRDRTGTVPGTRLRLSQFLGRRPNAEPFGHLKILMPLLLMLTMLFIASCELTGDFREVKADDLKKLVDQGAQILIVDNRTEYEYRDGHIPKAINISQEQFNILKVLLPKDKSGPIVFYCRGVG